uniref:ShKT domain-containing protein n=1 Tax=Caenorhabditis tropicalis TaxID=1561998 RepID=A0A1I7UUJ9_9PELO
MLFRPIVLFALFSFLLFVSCQDGDTSSSSTTDASSTSESSTSSSEAPCEDSPNTDCSSFKSYCTNDKYIPLLKSFCPVTCNLCPGATTVEPPTDSPNCYDSSSKTDFARIASINALIVSNIVPNHVDSARRDLAKIVIMSRIS